MANVEDYVCNNGRIPPYPWQIFNFNIYNEDEFNTNIANVWEVALKSHYKRNSHHPEHFSPIDELSKKELLCDLLGSQLGSQWKSGLRREWKIENAANIYVQLKIDEFCKSVDVNVILAVITSESNMDRLTIQMDQHKCQSIRNVNLQLGKGINAQPEIASSLFRKRIIAIEELSGRIDENLVKELTGNSQTSFRNLYEQNMGGRPSAKLFASTNTAPICTATEAFRARVIVFPFNSKFANFENNLETSIQIETDKYKLEKGDSIVDESFIGFFTLIYIHLFQNVDFNDGYIHIRPEPDILKEFKEQYLSLTSLYKQFKQYADVQIVEGEATTVTDLLSAIRQFLVETKRLGTVKDDDIIFNFDEEYGHLKQTKTHDSIYEMSAMDLENDEDEYEPALKTKKMTCIVYYENIIIRNLKKKFN
ncbi:uncharacterized protein NPIL_172971 [Nephila pilipes]|uniref:Uncharacterized protein n=1 Tax=Nephila pilipes TaxID=299642 RepID=A0A8X6TAQ0_NEPPI|nr:uncharacterized protein NPIL_172971 [Nephila pilipes]